MRSGLLLAGLAVVLSSGVASAEPQAGDVRLPWHSQETRVIQPGNETAAPVTKPAASAVPAAPGKPVAGARGPESKAAARGVRGRGGDGARGGGHGRGGDGGRGGKGGGGHGGSRR